MNGLVKDGHFVIVVELGLQRVMAGGLSAAVGSTTRVCSVVFVIVELGVALDTPAMSVSSIFQMLMEADIPVATAVTRFLGHGARGTMVGVGSLAKVARHVVFRVGGAGSQACMITVGDFVCASH